MEPMFNYLGHGSSQSVDVPQPAAAAAGRRARAHHLGALPQQSGVPNWLHGLVEEHCRAYDIDGIMWCNERRSPIDAALVGQAPHCFCVHCQVLAAHEGVDVDAARRGLQALWDLVTSARRGDRMPDGALVELLRVVYEHPEVLLWERFWVERNKELDRELYGIVKFCDSKIEFGLNVWNRNHLNPWRKAQWPWARADAVERLGQADRLPAPERRHLPRRVGAAPRRTLPRPRPGDR